MGWDPSLFIDHNLEFNNASELIEEFGSRVNRTVFVEIFSDTKEHEDPAPENFKGWRTYHWDDETLEDVYKANGLIELYDSGDPVHDDSLWVSSHSIMVGTKATTLLFNRWSGAIDWFNELALLPKEQMISHPYHQIRNNIFLLVKLFGGTKSILFCGDANGDIEDILWKGASIADTLSNFKDKINLIRYQDIGTFKCDPDENSALNSFIYSHTVIIDDFEDLILK